MPNPSQQKLPKEDRKTHIVALDGGLNTQLSALLLGSEKLNGLAIRLVNMESNKGYRRIKGFSAFEDLKNLEGSTKICGIKVHNEAVFLAKLCQNNSLFYTEQFDNAVWSKTSGTVTANVTISPFSTAVADLFADNTSVTQHVLFQSITKTASALPYVGSVFVKKAGITAVHLSLDDSAGNGISGVFDISSGAFITSAAAFGTGFSAINITAGITTYGNNWYRIHVGGTTNTATSLRLAISTYNGALSYAGTGTGLFVFGAKIEQASSLGFYTKSSTPLLTGTRYDIFRRTVSSFMWTRLTDESLAISSPYNVRGIDYNFTGTETLTFTDGTNDARKWNGTTLTSFAAGSNTGPKYATVFRNRLVLAGFSNNPHIAAVSVPNEDSNYSGSLGAIDLNFGASITGIKAFRQQLYMFGVTRIKTVTGTTRDNFVIDDVSTEMGCTAPDSLMEIGGDVYFWSTDGIRPLSATSTYGDVNLGTISIPIRPTLINSLQSDQYDTRELKAVLVRDKSQARYFFSKSTANSDDDVPGVMFSQVVGNTQTSEKQPANWEFSEILGINPACCASGYIGGKEYVMHGGFDGVPYRQESGTTFGGRNIITVYQSPHMDLSDPMIRKTLHELKLYLDAYADTEIVVSVIYDYGIVEEAQPANYPFTIDYASARYNDATSLYDDDDTRYSVNTSPVQVSNVEGSGKTVSIRVVCIDAASSYSLNGIAIDYNLEGRE